MNKGIQTLKELNDKLAKSFGSEQKKDEDDLLKSIIFKISGKQIKDAILAKVIILKAQLTEIEKKVQTQGTQQDSVIRDTSSICEESDVKEIPDGEWKVKVKKNEIERLERIARNIEEKRTFELNEWDLENYGL